MKIVKIDATAIIFDNGYSLTTHHTQDCCENHYLSFEDIELKDIENLEFTLGENNMIPFNKVEGYGVELLPKNNFPLRIPGYGYNNGYYSSALALVMLDENDNEIYVEDITECQTIDDGS